MSEAISTNEESNAQLEAMRQELEQLFKMLNVSPERLDADNSPIGVSIQLLREQIRELLASMQQDEQSI